MAKGKIRKAEKSKPCPTAALARSLGVPEAQIARGGLALRDVKNWTDADQRHTVRSNQKQGVRLLTRIERLQAAGTLTKQEAAACQWYADAHELGYATLGITANPEGGARGGGRSYCHLARYEAQAIARENYNLGRKGIPAGLLNLFESVVLRGKPITAWSINGHLGRSQRATRLSSSFKHATRKLLEHIGHLLPGC